MVKCRYMVKDMVKKNEGKKNEDKENKDKKKILNKKKILREMFLPFLFFVLILIDRLTKIYAREKQINPGAFLGFSFHPYFLLIVSSILIIFFLFLYFYEKNFFIKFGIVFLLAGAVSNFIDRVLYRGIIDWINFAFFTFNIADVYFWIGIAVVVFYLILKKFK